MSAEERCYGAHRQLAEAESHLAQASSVLERWPEDDEDGVRFSDHMRMAIDGLSMSVEALGEILWDRYGRRQR